MRRSNFLRAVLGAAATAAGTSALASTPASAAGRSGPAGTVAGVEPAAGARATTGARRTDEMYISFTETPGCFPLVARGRAVPLVVSSADHAGVLRVVDDLQTDLERITGVRPAISRDAVPRDAVPRDAVPRDAVPRDAVPRDAVPRDAVPRGGRDIVLIGTLGRSPLIDRLVAEGKLDVTGIAGQWETSLQQVVHDPLPGVRRAFVIAGSDQRGTIYGVYETSGQAGISPWHFWDDVPPRRRESLFVLPGRYSQGTPAVRYRGFFINDENPATGTWAPGYFGPGKAPGFPNGLNAAYFAKVFETLLRLKGNYLWPAVWGRAFAEDDPLNHETATRYGVVMGTSHEAPMMRGIEEWNRHAVAAVRDGTGAITTPGHDPYGGTGEWSFRRNGDALKQYWRDGARRMKERDIEGVITLGMRGNGDVSLPDGDGIDLMGSIIDTQRQILTETGLLGAPQVQTLYKEVQRYWDEGYRPPEDVTIVFCDDNWGNMRKLPDQSLPARDGGYGIYYHFDYVGGGRNYKWVDTVNLVNTWEQLHLTHAYGVDRLWMVNVGDMKNEELPLQFFLDYAWDPTRWSLEKLADWEHGYAAQNFGPGLAQAIADVLNTYGVLQSRRKPELLNRRITLNPELDPATTPTAVVYDDQGNPFSLTDYREMERVTAQWQDLAAKAEWLRRRLPDEYDDAFYQLVYYPVKATANLYLLRQAEFTNILYAAQGRAATNALAAEAEARFAEDQAMSKYYDTGLAGGKWAGWQTQPKIGYGNSARYNNAAWQQPQTDNHVALPDEIFPYVKRIEIPSGAELGVAIDGSTQWWPASTQPAVLPTFSPYQSAPGQYIEVFNRGGTPFPYTITSARSWVTVRPARGTVDDQVRAAVHVDWSRAANGITEVPLTVTGPDGVTVTVTARVDNSLSPYRAKGFVEANGYVSILADHYTRAVDADGVTWKLLPEIGKTGNGMTPWPVDAASRTPGRDGPRLEYRMTLTSSGPVTVSAILSPRNNVLPGDGLRYAISIDDAEPQIVNVTKATGADDGGMNRQWERNTSDNVNVTFTTHMIDKPGTHTLTFWMVDPTVIVQKLVVATTELPYSYFGPPESRWIGR